VSLDTFDDEEAMLSVVQSDPSKYDVIVASDSLIGEMSDLRLLAKLDLENVPNLANIDPEFLDQPWDPGNQYSVPYTWGSTGIVYNTKYIDSPDESWALLQDPNLAGRVALLNDDTVVIGMTLKYLGYSLNSADPDQLAQAVEIVRNQRALLAGFLDPITIQEQMLSGKLWAAQAYNGDAATIMGEDEDMAFFVPVEGSDVWVDNLAIPRDAKNKRAAEAFLNYVLRPDVQADISNYTEYATPNKAALEQGLIGQELLASAVSYPPRDLLEPWVQFTADQTALWNKAWADIQQGTAASSSP
jgi:spermidine/putrescine transport system substrate-binding protein